MKLDLSQIIDGYPGHEHALAVDAARRGRRDAVRARAHELHADAADRERRYQRPGLFHRRATSFRTDAKLNRFSPRFVVDVKTRQRHVARTSASICSPPLRTGAAEIQRAGGLVGIGAHGEMPGIGMHWEMEAHVMGGMTPLEAIHAATIGSAETIGRQCEFGSLEPGKYADLVILGEGSARATSATACRSRR